MTAYFYLCVFAFVLQNFVRFWAYTSCFKLKVKPWVGYAVFLSVTGVVSYVKLYCMTIDGSMVPFAPFLTAAGCFFPFHFLTEGNGRKKLLLSFIDQLLVDTFIEIALYIIIDRLFDYRSISYVFDFERFSMGIVVCVSAIPIKYIMAKIWNKKNKTESKGRSRIFIIFPIIQIVVIILFHIERYYSEGAWWIDKVIAISVYFIVFGVSTVVYLIFLSDIEKKNRLERENNTLNYMRQIEETRYTAIEEKQIETAKIRHDIKNQLITIKGLLKSGNSEEAAELINELETDINASKEKEYCSVPIINALLSEKEQVCVNKGITFESDIAISHTGCISKNHLCSIFSNLMDNAIKECGNVSEGERNIRITAAQKSGFITVCCENSAAEGGRRIIKPSESKGYGLKILRDMADRYDGRFKCEIREKRCVSEITVNILEQG